MINRLENFVNEYPRKGLLRFDKRKKNGLLSYEAKLVVRK